MSEPRPDPFARSDYRRLIAWSQRLEREWPFLERQLSDAPTRAVLDLGSGSGEHAAFLQKKGFDVTGVDVSEEQVRAAQDHARPEGPRFVQGAIADLATVAPGPFGGALCLGNVLPYLAPDELEASLRALSRVLVEGAVLITQMVNYPGLRERGVRHLPVNVRPGEGDDEVVFLRLLRHRDEEWTDFVPVTLHFGHDDEEPVRLDWSRRIPLRAWSREEMTDAMESCGLRVTAVYGGMQGEEFHSVDSHDVVHVAQRG